MMVALACRFIGFGIGIIIYAGMVGLIFLMKVLLQKL
jgi:hypothetical protein